MPDPLEALSLAGLRRMFYLVTPKETTFASVDDVPDYITLATPWFMLFVMVEFLVSRAEGRKLYAVNDSLTSMGGGILQSTVKLLTRGAEFKTYVWVYERYHLATLPWDWWGTWAAGFVAVDLGYYAFHRAGHETLLGWAFHQMHHSSEYYNFSTALRQGAVQGAFSAAFYLPFALVVPPQAFLAHMGLNVLYQFWIHTQYFSSLGPLEWLLNTPSHHRVHHGRNPYCIDRNYAGTLIVWDRLFGTFAAEKPSEEIAYGLTHPTKTFAPLRNQTHLFVYALWTRPRQIYRKEGLWRALQVPFRGPDWGHPPVRPVKYPVRPYDPPAPAWLSVYAGLHFFGALGTFVRMGEMENQSLLDLVPPTAFVLGTLHCLGLLFDRAPRAEAKECARVVLTTLMVLALPTAPKALAVPFAASGLFWLARAALGGIGKRVE